MRQAVSEIEPDQQASLPDCHSSKPGPSKNQAVPMEPICETVTRTCPDELRHCSIHTNIHSLSRSLETANPSHPRTLEELEPSTVRTAAGT